MFLNSGSNLELFHVPELFWNGFFLPPVHVRTGTETQFQDPTHVGTGIEKQF